MSKFKTGQLVYWSDPCIDEYDDPDEALDRIFEVTSYNPDDDVYSISEVGGPTTADVYEDELEAFFA